jgi:ABC-type transport system substrate-binding protein
MTKKTLYVLMAVMMLTAMVASCAPQATPTSAPPPTSAPAATQPPQATQPPAPTAVPPTAAPTAAPALKILRYQAPEPQMEPDMAKSNTSVSITFSGFINDYLLGYTEDNKVKLMLAEKYEPNADYTVWTIKLRDNAKFSDGTDVTTADLVWTINHYKQFDVQKSVYNLVKDVEVIDAKNAKIHLTESHSDWLYLHPTAIYSKACDAGCDFYSPKTPTSGPWMIKEYIQKDHMTLVKNPNYWGLKEADPFPKIDQVTGSSNPT